MSSLPIWFQEKAVKRTHKYGCAIVGLALSLHTHAIGMTDTTVQLGTVVVDTTQYRRVEMIHWNTTTMTEFTGAGGRKASEVLSDFSGIYLKNYGIGQLSSISLKGSSAAQTELQWNGIKLNNPNTGQVDLSLFDIGNGDRLTVSDHGAYGNSVGGVVAIENELKMPRNTTVCSDNTIRIGSFGEHAVASYNRYRLHKFMGATRVCYLGADNDFTFVSNTVGAPIFRETNAATRLLSLMQQLQYSFPKAVVLGLDFWMTDADRQLPPVMTIYQNSERQWDRSYRAMAHLSGRKGKWTYDLRSAYLSDRLRYVDSATAIDSRSASQAIRNIFTARYEWRPNLILEGRAHYDREMAQSSGYDLTWARDLYGTTVEVRYDHKNGFNAKANVGIEGQDTRILPMPAMVSLGYIGKFHREMLIISVTGCHAYRLPGMNDLYWSAGGNPGLRPEKAWKGDLNIGFLHSYWIKVLADGFYNYVNDWIQWSPESGSAIWTAQNLKRVVSRGMTVEVKMQSVKDLSTRAFAISGGGSYTYTNTVTLDAISANDNSQGKQLIYVPLHNFIASVRVQYRRFYLRATQTYTGLRYVATDNSQALNPYILTHIEVGKDLYLKDQRISLSFRINNIANQQYQLVSQRPMPGRSFEGTLKVNLSK